MTAPQLPPASGVGMPAAEVPLDADVARRLLRAQHPDLAELPITQAAVGWDNVIFRLGDELQLRMPKRMMAAALILLEQVWLPTLAPQLPLAVPAMLRRGEPDEAYPFTWVVARWLPGAPADVDRPRVDQAPVLAGFMKALHGLAPPADAPINPYRSPPLSARRARFDDLMTTLAPTAHGDDFAEALPIWRAALEAPCDVPHTWIHADMHARNVLVADGAFSAVIDWGDMCKGDPATDLAGAWMLFADPDARRRLLQAYGASETTILRAKGWALAYAAMLIDAGLINNPPMLAIGLTALKGVLEDR